MTRKLKAQVVLAKKMYHILATKHTAAEAATKKAEVREWNTYQDAEAAWSTYLRLLTDNDMLDKIEWCGRREP